MAENVKKGLFTQFFSTYTDSMFAQLLHYCNFKQLDQGELLYDRGTPCDYFYFLITGELKLTFCEDNETTCKFNEAGIMFGFRDSKAQHSDFANATQPNTQVLAIPLFIYKDIITQTQLKAANKKIDFLVRFGPAFRTVEFSLI